MANEVATYFTIFILSTAFHLDIQLLMNIYATTFRPTNTTVVSGLRILNKTDRIAFESLAPKFAFKLSQLNL
jgi:hypothetical protein